MISENSASFYTHKHQNNFPVHIIIDAFIQNLSFYRKL